MYIRPNTESSVLGFFIYKRRQKVNKYQESWLDGITPQDIEQMLKDQWENIHSGASRVAWKRNRRTLSSTIQKN